MRCLISTFLKSILFFPKDFPHRGRVIYLKTYMPEADQIVTWSKSWSHLKWAIQLLCPCAVSVVPVFLWREGFSPSCHPVQCHHRRPDSHWITLCCSFLFLPSVSSPRRQRLSGIHVPSGKAAGLALVCRSKEGARVDIPRTQEHVWVGGGSGLRHTSALALTAHLRFLSLEGTGIGPTFYEYGRLLVKGTFQ